MDAGIPIIGRTREWKQVAFVVQPLTKQATVVVPGVIPEISGWQFGFVCERSDGIPVQLINVVEVEKLGADPLPRVFRMMQVLTQKLEEYRTCACQPGTPCRLHTQQVAQGRAS